ncbi:hypothetical protein B484DRAFT_237660 [Ochromonadaceae sp. CCMP2298]|nr:hypothetical protein B484DRAFT_237660 [Ochromonadaceae sp. CCMP2298]
MGSLAYVLGPNFVPYFDQYLLLLMGDRVSRQSLDCIAHVIGLLGPTALKYAQDLLPALARGLAHSDQGVRKNSARCLSSLVYATDSALAPQFPTFLVWLSPLCCRGEANSGSDTGGGDVDNALAALAVLIDAPSAAEDYLPHHHNTPTSSSYSHSGMCGPCAHPSIPLPQVLPALLQALPLREDASAGLRVYACLGLCWRPTPPPWRCCPTS